MELHLAEKCTLQQNMRLIPNHLGFKNIPVERDWACDARGASRQDVVFARVL